MKFKLICILIFANSCISYAQSISTEENKKIELAARTWGFVTFKTEKKISNPDKELLRLIQLSFTTDSFSTYREKVAQWVSKNLLFSCDSSLSLPNSTIMSSFYWVTDTAFVGKTTSEKLIQSLNCISKKPNPQHTFVGAIPVFYKGRISKNAALPSRAERLLACIKYWNIVRYFYAYPENKNTNWDSTLTLNISKFSKCNSNQAYYTNLLQMAYILGDSHARIYSTWASDSLFKYEFPFEAEIYPHYTIVTSVDSAYANIIHPNDQIIAIGDYQINEIVAYWDTLISTSTKGWFLHTIRNFLFNTIDTNVSITIVRNSDTLRYPISLSENRNQKEISHDQIYTITKDSIGYINLGNLHLYHIESMKKQLQSTKVIIIDARFYPNSTFLALSPWLVDAQKLFARHFTQDVHSLGRFSQQDSSISIPNEPNRYKGTVLWLIDRSTISQGEFMTLAFMQSLNTITIGRTTAGAIGVTTQFELPGKTTCRITTSKVLTPDYKSIQQHGITPMVDYSEDEEILTSEDLLAKAYQYARRIIQLKKTDKTDN